MTIANAMTALTEGKIAGFVVEGTYLTQHKIPAFNGRERKYKLVFQMHPMSGNVCCSEVGGIRRYGPADSDTFDEVLTQYTGSADPAPSNQVIIRQAEEAELTVFGDPDSLVVEELSDAELRAMGFTA
ncbi:MAG: hypothetical protein VX730_00570 [Pseudomonadota bacterium]|nr:hypothetical protein [Pseudomonadota bacterium]